MPDESDHQVGASPEEQKRLLLDMGQFVLDIVGIFEPTPFADGSNALISMGRGDWLGAGLSAISIFPYLGDFAELGKLPKYSRSVNRAVELASKDTAFAKKLLFQYGISFNDIPNWQKRGVGLFWDEYDKPSLNHVTNEGVTARRRRIRTEFQLPMKDEYGQFVRSLISQPQTQGAS